MRALVVLVCLLSCSEVRAHDCGDVDVDAAVDAAVDAWPDLADTAVPLDVFCEDLDKVHRTCRHERAESCALFGAVPGRAARIVVDVDADDVDALIVHELQHLRPGLPDMCRTHAPSCWEPLPTVNP